MTKAAIERNKKIANTMKNFKVTPFEKVSERLSAATKKTILAIDKDKKINIGDL